MTTIVDHAPAEPAQREPVFITLPVPPPSAAAPPDRASSGGASGPVRRPSFRRRHRVGLMSCAAALTLLAGGVGMFIYKWNHTGPREVSVQRAYLRFRSGSSGQLVDPGKLRPHEGVYTYRGRAAEHVSLPPKSQVEGPSIPGTVSYRSDGCWVQRLDYSNNHWQNSTYCPRNGNLVEVARAGWYRWDLVALSVSDTATFTCARPEIALPEVLRIGTKYSFSCTGTNTPLKMDVVTMVGTNQYVGPQTLTMAGSRVPTLHFHEVTHFGGGQTGYNVADTWFSTVNGLPVHGTWTTVVTSPTFLGKSTLTGNGDYSLSSLVPRS